MSKDVPKFTSFRPKPTSESSPLPNKDDVNACPDQASRPARDVRYEPHRRHRHSQTRSTLDNARLVARHSGSRSPRQATHASSIVEKPGPWILDSKGDQSLIQFETTQSFTRHRPSNVKPLGHEPGHDNGGEAQQSPLTTLSRRALRALELEETCIDPSKRRLLGISHDQNHEETGADFVSVEPSRKRKKSSAGLQKTNLETGDEEGGDVSEVSGSESDPSAAIGSSEKLEASLVRQRHDALQKTVKEQPTNSSAWLELEEFQDEWVAYGLNVSSAGSTKSDRSTVANLKLSVLDSGIKSLTENAAGREVLLLRKLEVYESFLMPSEIMLKWRDATLENPHFGEVALRYLHLLHNGAFGNSVDNCRKEYGRVLKDVLEGQGFTINQTLCVLCRFTIFLRGTGFSELAVAIWQMCLELRIFTRRDMRPSGDIEMRKRLVSAFEDFWDLERPRIGEIHANGWQAVDIWKAEVDKSSSSAQSFEPTEAIPEVKAWALKEIANAESSQLPGKTMDEGSQDDPYHTVLFADLEPYFDACGLEYGADALVNAFLAFCGLPNLQPRTANSIFSDQGIHDRQAPDFLSGGSAWRDNCRISNEGYPTRSPAQLSCSRSCTESLFGQVPARCSIFEDRISFCPNFVERVLCHFVQCMPEHDDLAEYYLAFVCARSANSARKAARSILKQRPESLRLYAAFALIELQINGSDASDRVFATAIKLSGTLPSDKAFDVIGLWRCWVWQALREAKLDEALRRLAAIGFHTPEGLERTLQTDVSKIDLLRAKDLLQSGLEAALASNRTSHAVTYVQLLTYLAYLSTTPTSLLDASTALEKYTHLIPSMTDGAHHELLYQSLSLLVLHHHYTQHSHAQTLNPELQRCLQTAAIRFPHNYIILAALSQSTPRTDRVRALLMSSSDYPKKISPLLEPETLTAWAVVIETEINRATELDEPVSAEWAIRRSFERATTSELGKHCPALWSWWLAWEIWLACGDSISRQQKEVTKKWRRARDLWRKGMVVLPWLKEWVVQGLVVFGDAQLVGEGLHVGAEEAQGLLDGLVDKGIRFCADTNQLSDT